MSNFKLKYYYKKVRDDDGGKKPVFKVGIVFPFSNFKRRKYEQYIRISLAEIAQERCFHEDSDEYVPYGLSSFGSGIQN